MKTAFSVLLLATFAVASSAQMNPAGTWNTVDDKTGQPKAEIRLVADGSGVLTGTIVKSLGNTGGDPNCDLCTDDRKGKPKIGMEIIRGAKKAEDKEVWEGGRILDPENGKTYGLRLTPIDGGAKLEVRGSIGPFGRTQTWVRAK